MNVVLLTDAAKARIKKIVQQKPEHVFRISVKKTGCSGLKYVSETVAKPETTDIKISSDLEVYVDGNAVEFLRGTELHCVEKGLGWQWEFRNPNAYASCGCGESFNMKKNEK